MNVRILVSGASIAGPALTFVGRGVAKEVIRRMGLDATVRAAC